MTTPTLDSATKSIRLALIVGGAAAVIFGIAVLVWPGKTAVVVTGVIAVYAILAGLVYAALGAVAKNHTTGWRVGHVLLGVLYILAGAFAFAQLQESAAFLGIFVTIMIGIMWLVEGFTALFSLGEADSKGLTIFFAVISVLAGFSLISTPLWSAAFLWWLVGISMVVLGALNVFRGLSRKG